MARRNPVGLENDDGDDDDDNSQRIYIYMRVCVCAWVLSVLIIARVVHNMFDDAVDAGGLG